MKMVAPRVHFSVKNLEKLLKDEESCVHLKKFKKHLSLDPSELTDTKGAIKIKLSNLISKYDSEMDGVVLGFRRMNVTSSLGKILNDNPHIHFDVEAEFFIFRPEIGCTLTGIVKKMNNDCIGCLVHDNFNVTIPIEYNNNHKDQEDFYCGQQLTFVVDFIDFTSSLPYIKGKLVESQENFELSQSPDVETPGSYVMNKKMKKRKTKLYTQSSVSNKSTEDDDLKNELVAESDDNGVSDWKNEVLSFSGMNVTSKQPISILKKDKVENTPSKRISFSRDIPSSLEKEQSIGPSEELSKVKKSKKKAKSSLETKPESREMADSKKTKKEKKKRMIPEKNMSHFRHSQLTSQINEMGIVSEDPLNDSPTKKKKKKERKSGLNTSVFHDDTHSDIDVKEDEKHKSKNIDSMSDFPQSQLTSLVNEMEIINEDLVNDPPTKKKKKKDKKSGFNTSPFHDTHSDVDAKEDEKDKSIKMDSREKKGKKIKNKEKNILESIEFRGVDDNDGAKSKIHKISTENLDLSSCTHTKLDNQTNFDKTTKKQEDLFFPEGLMESKEIKSRKRKRSSELLDIPTGTESLKLNDQKTSVSVKSKELKTLSEPSQIDSCKEFMKALDLSDRISLTSLHQGVKSKKRKRAPELLGSTLSVGVDLENNSREMNNELSDIELETKRRDSLIINPGNEKDKSSNSPKKKKKRQKGGEYEIEEEVKQTPQNKVVSNENSSSECIGEKKVVTPRKGIGFSSLRTEKSNSFTNSPVNALSFSERNNTSSTSIDEDLFDLPSPIKKVESEEEMLDEIRFITSTQIDPEDNVFDKALSNINRKQKGLTIAEPDKSLKTKLKLPEKVQTKGNVSKSFKTSIQSKSPSKTKSTTVSKLSDSGATDCKNLSPSKLGKQLLTSLVKSQKSSAKTKTESESELDSSDPDLPSHFKNSSFITNLETKFKSAKERDTDKDTGALESGTLSPQKKGKNVLEHSGITLESEHGDGNPGRPSSTAQKLKKIKSTTVGITSTHMPREGSKKSKDNDSMGEDTAPSLEKLSKTSGKSNKLKKQSKNMQYKEKKSLSFSPDNLSSLTDELLKNI